MELSTEQINMIKRMGASLFSINEVAIVIEVDAIDLERAIKNPNSAAHKSYYTAKLTTELELRESIIKVAKRGSNPAQKLTIDMLERTNGKNK